MSTLEELRETVRKAQTAIGRIEERRRKETNSAHIGHCFKYRNNFSCPEKPSDYWWLYIRVTGLHPDGSLKYTEFQID